MTRQTITKKVTDVISATMGINLPDIDKTMSELGVDMISVLEIRDGINKAFKRELPYGLPESFDSCVWDMSIELITDYIEELV